MHECSCGETLGGFDIDQGGRVSKRASIAATYFCFSAEDAVRFAAEEPTFHDVILAGGDAVAAGCHRPLSASADRCSCGALLGRYVITSERVTAVSPTQGMTHYCHDADEAERVQAGDPTYHDVRHPRGHLLWAGQHVELEAHECVWAGCKVRVAVWGQPCSGHLKAVTALSRACFEQVDRELGFAVYYFERRGTI